MPVFFNGRLWVSPATMSVVDDSALFNKNPSVGNVLALVGVADAGEPNKVYRVGSVEDAKKFFRAGDLVKAIEKAFDPSSETGAPATIVAIRAGSATRSTLTLNGPGATPLINLSSTEFGVFSNRISVKVENGSLRGKKITTNQGVFSYTQDNIYASPFAVKYNGTEATATINVDNVANEIRLEAPSGTVVNTIDLRVFRTAAQVRSAINATAGFVATLTGVSSFNCLDTLDKVTAADVKTPAAPGYAVTATLDAIVKFFNGNGEGLINAVRVPDSGDLPVNIPETFFIGGTGDNAVTFEQWGNAIAKLQEEDIQWLVPLTDSAAVHAMADSHVAFMSNVARMERRCVVGMQTGVTDEAAIEAALALNSDRTSLVHLGFYDFNDRGELALFPAYILAAQIAGAFAGSNPGTSLTNKSLKIRGLERKLRNPTDTDQLILGGVLAVEETNTGFKVVQSITTWLNNDNYNRVEVSVGVALDFVSRNIRNILDPLRGQKGTPQLLGQAVNRVDSLLRELARPEPQGPGVLAGDAQNPAYKNILASLEGDVLRVEFQCSPVIPANYIPVSIFAVPYSGSATTA